LGLVNGPGQGHRAAPEFDGRGIGQKLPFPRDKDLEKTDDRRPRGGGGVQQAGGRARPVSSAEDRGGLLDLGLAGVPEPLEKRGKAADQGQERRVAPGDVAHFVGDDRLDFIPGAVGQ